MIINYLNEAGPFGSYKKATAKSNLANVKRELTREATNHILERHCDELAELYLDMLNEVNSKINEISNNAYKFNGPSGLERMSNLLELSTYTVNYFTMSRRKELQLNLIKNVYCNNLAIEYMVSKGCFILPIIDTTRRWSFFTNSKEIIPYKNMTKAVADAAEKIIKSHLSKFPNYASAIPNKVKIVILQNNFSLDLNSSILNQNNRQFFSYMGVKNDDTVDFDYPAGQGSSCLNHILDNYTLIKGSCTTIKLIKSDEPIWKGIAEPSPWMFNKIILGGVSTDLSTISADNFYGVKILKFAFDNGLLSNKVYPYTNIFMDNAIKNIKLINKLKQEISNNGLDGYVKYDFNDIKTYVESYVCIGKEIDPMQAVKKEGIIISELKRSVYEFDYNDTTEVKDAVKAIINGCSKFLTDDDIKKIVEDKIEEYLPLLMSKVLEIRQNSISSSNKILLCDYHYQQKGTKGKSNIRVVIDPNKIGINKNNSLVFYIELDFKLPVRGVNPNYKNTSKRTSGKNYEFISGKKIKIEIPL